MRMESQWAGTKDHEICAEGFGPLFWPGPEPGSWGGLGLSKTQVRAHGCGFNTRK